MEDDEIKDTPIETEAPEKEAETKAEETGVSKDLADKLTEIACKRVKAWVDFSQPRMNQIREIEDILAYKLQPALKGRINVPFDGIILNGFKDTLLSQIKEFPKVVFKDSKGSNMMGVQKTQAFFEEDTSQSKGKWKKRDRLSKSLCAISNIGIYEIHASSKSEYKSYLNNIDHYDFIAEPNGGNDIEEHNIVGRRNLFKNNSDLESEVYNKTQVEALKKCYTDKEFKLSEDLYKNKVARYNALNLDIETNSYVGEGLYNLTEVEMEYKGVRYYLLFDYKSQTWIRCELLKDIFKSNLYSYCVWNATEPTFGILGPGPADMMRVIAESIRLNLNEILNNNRKKNWDMTAVDSEMFPDISDLDWRQDGVVVAKVPFGQSIQNGIYKFQTPDISGAINLNAVISGLVGLNSGISDQTKGSSSQDTLGIANLDQLNLSKRMSLISDSYNECMSDLVLRWDWNQWEHLDDEYAIKILGKNGPELTHFNKQDSEPDYEVSIIVNTNDVAKDKLTTEAKKEGLKLVVTNPALMGQFNPKWLGMSILSTFGFSEEEIKIGMSKEDYAAEQVSKANKAIELILLKQEPDDVPDATPMFLEVIHNYIVANKFKMEPEVKLKMEAYWDKQSEYATMNAIRTTPPPEVTPVEKPVVDPALTAKIQ